MAREYPWNAPRTRPTTEVKLATETVDQAYHPKLPKLLIADKAYDSDKLRDEMADKFFCSFLPSTDSQTLLASVGPKNASILAQMDRRKDDFLAWTVSPNGCSL